MYHYKVHVFICKQVIHKFLYCYEINRTWGYCSEAFLYCRITFYVVLNKGGNSNLNIFFKKIISLLGILISVKDKKIIWLITDDSMTQLANFTVCAHMYFWTTCTLFPLQREHQVNFNYFVRMQLPNIYKVT